MSVPQPEIKQSVEDSIVIPMFDWGQIYSEPLRKILKQAVESQSNTLNLNIADHLDLDLRARASIEQAVTYNMPQIVAFLNANPNITTLNVSGNFVFPSTAHPLLERQNRTTVFQHQRLAFLMGAHRRLGRQSAILKFLIDPLCDRINTLKKIFGFLAPAPFHFIHSFSPEIMQTFSCMTSSSSSATSCASKTASHELEETKVACETKETKEQGDSDAMHAEDSMMQSALAEPLSAMTQALRDLNLALSRSEIDVPSHNETNETVVFSFDGGSSSSSSSATSTSSVFVEVENDAAPPTPLAAYVAEQNRARVAVLTQKI